MNEILFYGGIAAAAAGAAGLFLSVIVFFYKKARLNLKYDKEYGEKNKQKGR